MVALCSFGSATASSRSSGSSKRALGTSSTPRSRANASTSHQPRPDRSSGCGIATVPINGASATMRMRGRSTPPRAPTPVCAWTCRAAIPKMERCCSRWEFAQLLSGSDRGCVQQNAPSSIPKWAEMVSMSTTRRHLPSCQVSKEQDSGLGLRTKD